VIIKDAFVYSNKGFKSLNQAQLLTDVIYHPDAFDSQPWLVYYISRPLTGTYEAVKIIPATLDVREKNARKEVEASKAREESSANGVRKKDIKSFGDLLNNFPMIARQMQPGLERLFKELASELEKPLPATPGASVRPTHKRQLSESSMESRTASLHSSLSNGSHKYAPILELDDEEDIMRRSLETAVTAAIDLFQMVDKQQLSNLGATTDLTGPVVERMIERYVAEQIHDNALFPRICTIRRLDDSDLEMRVRQMQDIDVSQVGIPIDHGRRGKRELAHRLSKGVDVFKKMGVASSPQEMMDILLETQKVVTMPDTSSSSRSDETNTEKQDAALTINADTLVSLLLVVVIRSPVRHLQARLSYMRHFIFIDDVESGEFGYALSTFEAVLSYLSRDSAGLRKSSRRNRRLWQATKKGNLGEMKEVLEPDSADETSADDVGGDNLAYARHHGNGGDRESLSGTTIDAQSTDNGWAYAPSSDGASLSHVFPFQRPPTPPPDTLRPPAKKRVSMDTRSMSSSSGYSFASRSTSMHSHTSGPDGDTSIEKLCKTQGSEGESVMMMAVESGQAQALRYLLSLTEYYSLDDVLGDASNEGTTLLSAAVQQGNAEVTDVILSHLTRDESVRHVRLLQATGYERPKCCALSVQSTSSD